jgi:hypothetical protein
MTQCTPNPTQLALDFHRDRPVVVTFDAPQTSSDGGALLLRQVDDRLGLSEWMAHLLPDRRDAAKTQHSVQELLRQRIYQIALGYEDCNDATWLRHDPALKTACDRMPFDGGALSSQPTLSRLENSVSMRVVTQMARAFIDRFVGALPADTDLVILDIDATDDETHGGQQLSFFHGYYDHHMYHPLLLFSGTGGELITALLRPGNVHAGRGAARLLRRVIRAIKHRFPSAQVVVRGDAGFSLPQVMNELERLNAELGDVDYLLGVAKNDVLLRLAAPVMDAARQEQRHSGGTVKHFSSFPYATKETWPHPRRVVVKAEHSEQGANPRFVVTSLDGVRPDWLYHAYIQRGAAENWIKDLKNALAADRLSCCRFAANAFRLVLHSAAYVLMHALRTHLAPHARRLATAQFDTLRLRLLKVAAVISQSTRRILVRLPQAFPFAAAFHDLAFILNGARAPA